MRIKKTMSNKTKLQNTPEFEEWKGCRSSIARFDEAVLNIREYGFTLLTLLISADGFLYSKLESDSSKQTGAIAGICIALMLLVLSLFRVDRFHEVFLRAAVGRSEELEKSLGMKLSAQISQYSKECKTETWGVRVYISFIVANILLALGAVLDFNSFSQFTDSVWNNWLFVLIIVLAGISIALLIASYHRKTKNKLQMLQNVTEGVF